MVYDPNKFKTASQAQATYDITDTQLGIGIDNYYFLNTAKSTGVDYKLSGEASYSNNNTTEGTSQNDGNSFDLDFDLTEFQMTKILKGFALVYVPWRVDFTSGGGSNASYSIRVKIRKWDGTTETEIGSESTIPIIGADIGDPYYNNTVMSINIPETVFNIGETLRVSVIGIMTPSGGVGTAKITLLHDPSNATDANYDFTQLKIAIPSKLNL